MIEESKTDSNLPICPICGLDRCRIQEAYAMGTGLKILHAYLKVSCTNCGCEAPLSSWNKREYIDHMLSTLHYMEGLKNHPLIKFLQGEGKLNGLSFGDIREGAPGQFWWRKELKELLLGLERAGQMAAVHKYDGLHDSIVVCHQCLLVNDSYGACKYCGYENMPF